MRSSIRYALLFALFVLAGFGCHEAGEQARAGEPDEMNSEFFEAANDARLPHEARLEACIRAVDASRAQSEWEAYFLAISELGEQYQLLDRHAEAIELLRSAIEEYPRRYGARRTPALGALYKVYANCLVMIADYAPALANAQKAVALFDSLDLPAEKGGGLRVLGLVHLVRREPEQALATLEAALELLRGAKGDQAWEIGRCLSYFGAVHHNQYHIDKAIDYYGQSLVYAERAKDSAFIAYNLRNLGMQLSNKGAHEDALAHCFKALEIQKAFAGERHSRVAHTYLFIGNIYFDVRDYLRATVYYERAFELQMALLGPTHPATAGVLMNKGNALKYLGRYEEAIQTFEEVIRLQQRNLNPDYNHFKVHRNMGLTYQMSGDTARARAKFLDALAAAPKFLEPESMVWVDIYLDLASVAESLDEAEMYTREAFQRLFADRDDPLALTPADFERAPDNTYLFQVIATRTRFAFQRFQRSGYDADLERAYRYCRKGMELVDYIFARQPSDESKSVFSGLAQAHFAQAAAIAWAFHSRGAETWATDWAFELMEKNKALLLREALAEKHIQAALGVPDSLLDNTRQIGRAIAEIQWRLANATLDSASALVEVYALKQRLAQREAEIEQAYPRYRQLRRAYTTPTIEEVRAYLADGESLLVEFALEERHVSAIAIHRDTTIYYRQALDERFFPRLDTFLALAGEVPARLSDAQALEREKRYLSLGHELYSLLLDPLLRRAPAVQQLILIPDGELSYLPFEVLLSRPAADAGGYRAQPFLLKSHHVRYEYSAGLLLEGPGPKIGAPAYNLIAFAPDFGAVPLAFRETSDSLRFRRAFPELRKAPAPLAHNLSEVESIRAIVGGLAFTGARATKSAFQTQAPRCRIVHLATHAFTSDVHPNYSHLVLAEEPDRAVGPLLYAYDLYHLRLDAELAVLSACETGAGKFQRGEGAMSLARAFKYAGCPNIVTSLWKVDDESAKDIMVEFYAKLQHGLGKSEALREAKLAFLEKVVDQRRTHPFYWGAFILIGDNKPVELSRPGRARRWLVLGLLGLGLIAAGTGAWLWRARR
jgi:CHAT domain-containing protein/Tfp pilus assembly protein PilF